MRRQRFAVMLCGGVAAVAMLLWSAPSYAAVEDVLKTADQYFDGQQWKRAAREYDKAIRKWPTQVPAGSYARRATIYFTLKQNVEGLKFIDQKALKQHPGASEILSVKAAILWDMRQGDKARAAEAARIADVVAKKKPDEFVSQQIVGDYNFSKRHWVKAARGWAAYLKYRPKSQEKFDLMPLVKLGYAYLGSASESKDAKQQTQLLNSARERFDELARRFHNSARATANANNGLCATHVALKNWDRAITVCEKLTNGNYIDRRGSAYYNIGRAYLAKRQPRKARTAGNEFINKRPSLAKGYLLVGDAYFQERDWEKALRYYLDAEKKARGDARVSAKIGIKLGLAYRAKADSCTGTRSQKLSCQRQNYKLAIGKLETAIRADPQNPKLAQALGSAYLGQGQDRKALGTVDKLIRNPKLKVPAHDKTRLLSIAAKAFYNQKKLKMARARFEAARKLSPRSVTIRIGLVQTINAQAHAAFLAHNTPLAIKQLNAARQIRPSDSRTNQNLAVVEIQKGRCAGARKFLKALSSDRSYYLIYHRLMARTYLCQRRPDRRRAISHFARAEKEAISTNANLIRAEIYTEWAPLLFKSNLKDAVSKLEVAEQFSASTPGIANAVKRNLSVALFLRGRQYLKRGKYAAAAADFDRATRDPRVLEGVEPEAFQFSYAMAELQRGRTGTASKIFRKLARKGNQGKYLKSPYNRVGAQFFAALAKYRGGSVALRRQAANEFERLLQGARGRFATQVRTLLASSWQFIAWDAARRGNRRAGTYLRTAAKYAVTAAGKRNIAHNRAVMAMGSKGTRELSVFRSMGTNPAEALVNLGVMYQRSHKPKAAYNAWVRARRLGVRTRKLNSWINRKKRIWNF